jgi:hypothetical protein
MKVSAKTLYAGVGLAVASLLALLSFHRIGDITGNMLILVAQFLLYSLTLLGFGEIVRYIVSTVKNHEDRTVLHSGSVDKDILPGGQPGNV